MNLKKTTDDKYKSKQSRSAKTKTDAYTDASTDADNFSTTKAEETDYKLWKINFK
jgi:hypothetical protein